MKTEEILMYIVMLAFLIIVAYIIINMFKDYPKSVVFDRDEKGRIVAVHYVPGAMK